MLLSHWLLCIQHCAPAWTNALSCVVQSTMPRPTPCWLAGRTDPFYLPPAQSSERIGSWYIEEDPGEVDREGRRNTTLVHEAAQDNRLAALRLLLAVAPASAWAARSRQWLPIDLALCRRHTDAVQLLLATMPAAGLGADEVAELLLEAARSRQWNAMHMLLDAAAPGSLSSLATDVRARLLLGAAGSDSLRLLQTILDACPDAAALHSLYGSETPLQRAAAAGQSAAVDLLFEALPGIAAAIPEGSSWTQLHMAAACGAASEAQALLASHPEAALERTGQEETALHLAAACGRESVVRLLLEAAPQAAALAMRTGATACELAVQHGHAGTLAVLLPAAPEAAIAAALRRACSNGCEAAVQAILAAAPDAVLLRQEGQLPIHAAAEAGHASILERLLAVAPGTASAVVERQGYRGGTGDSPLHLAAGRCQLAAGRCPCAAQRSP